MRARTRHALLSAVGYMGALLIVGLVASKWPFARSHDAEALIDFRALAANARLDEVATWIAKASTPLAYALTGALVAAVALARRRLRLAVAMPASMGAASATTELLKPLVARVRGSHWVTPGIQIPAASWPSGHATAAMMVALCAVVVSPPGLRLLVALLGCVLALDVSYSLLIRGSHLPSDVLGGYFVAGTSVSLTLAMLWRSERRRAPSHEITEGAAGMRTALAAGVLAAMVLGALIVYGGIVPNHAPVGGTLIAAATAIGLVAVVMTGLLVAGLRPLGDAHLEAAATSSRSLPPAPSWPPGR